MKDLNALPRDLISLEAEVTFDITGLSTAEVTLSISPGILPRTAIATEKDGEESATRTATSWLPTAPEATELRTDDMQHIGDKMASKPTHMGDEMR